MAFTPAQTTLFKREFETQLEKNTVLAALCNRQYQGDLALNGTVKILTLDTAITVSDYDMHSDLTFQDTVTAFKDMSINQAKTFSFQVDKKTLAQITPQTVQQFGALASQTVGLALDAHIYAHRADVHSENVIGTDGSPITLTASNVVQQFLKLEEKMNISGVPMSGRWLAVTNEVGTLLKETAFGKVALTGGDSGLAVNQIAKVGTLRIFESNVLRPISGKHYLLAGDTGFINLAVTVDEVKTFEPEKNFNAAVKGLMVYGSKVFDPKRGGLIIASI